MSDRAPDTTYLLPPPRLAAPAELPPHLGGLRLERFSGEVPEEIEPFATDAHDDAFTAEQASAVLERTLARDAVRKRLGAARSHPIGVSRIGEPTKGEARQYLVVVYDYIANRAVEVTVDEGTGEISGITESRTQPVATQAELERAVTLARSDTRLGDLEDLEALTIQVEPDELGLAEENHRVVEVLFACRGERLPRFRAWVDLSTEQVVKAGQVEHCCDGGQDR